MNCCDVQIYINYDRYHFFKQLFYRKFTQFFEGLCPEMSVTIAEQNAILIE